MSSGYESSEDREKLGFSGFKLMAGYVSAFVGTGWFAAYVAHRRFRGRRV